MISRSCLDSRNTFTAGNVETSQSSGEDRVCSAYSAVKRLVDQARMPGLVTLPYVSRYNSCVNQKARF